MSFLLGCSGMVYDHDVRFFISGPLILIDIYIFSAWCVWCAAVASAPLLWSMVLHLRVTFADLKIYIIRTGALELKSACMTI
jgi:hypothetical protein